MNIPRISAVAALGAAAVLTLSGCIQLPSVPSTPTTTQPTTTDPGTPTSSEPTAPDTGSDLADTHWTGNALGPTADINIDISFTFEADGTLLIDAWNDETGVPFDDPGDTWSVEGDQLELRLSSIEEIQYIDFAGTAGTSPIQMTGIDGNGLEGYTITITEG